MILKGTNFSSDGLWPSVRNLVKTWLNYQDIRSEAMLVLNDTSFGMFDVQKTGKMSKKSASSTFSTSDMALPTPEVWEDSSCKPRPSSQVKEVQLYWQYQAPPGFQEAH